MALLTKQEFLSLNNKKEEVKKSDITAKEEKPLAVIDDKKFVYVLLFPENTQENFSNFEDIIKIDNKEYSRKCINGLVKTNEEILANFLIKKEYILLEKSEVFGNA